MLGVLLVCWYLAVYGAYGVCGTLTDAQQSAMLVLWPLLSLERSLAGAPAAC